MKSGYMKYKKKFIVVLKRYMDNPVIQPELCIFMMNQWINVTMKD